MRYIVTQHGNPEIFITNDDVVCYGESFRSELRALVYKLEGQSVTVDVTAVASMPIAVAATLMHLSIAFRARGGEVNLRATERITRPLEILGAASFFRSLDVQLA